DVPPERAGGVAGGAEEAAGRIRALLSERAPEPSAWGKPPRLGERPGKGYDCWTLVELDDGRPTRHSLELLGKGRELAGKLGGDNVALIVGAKVDDAAAEAARFCAHRIGPAEGDRHARFPPALHAAALRAAATP